MSVGVDVDGSGGSVLPELVVEIVDPAKVNPNKVKHFGQLGISLVQ